MAEKGHKTDEKFQILKSVIKSFYFVVGAFWLVVLDFSVSSSEGKQFLSKV